MYQALFSPPTHEPGNEASYGVDWDGPPPVDGNSTNEVVVPETNCPLSPTQLAELHACVV